MPKRISKEDEETFLFNPRDSGGLDIVIDNLSPDIMDFYNSLKNKKNKISKSKELIKEKKTYKESNIMKARSDLKKKGDKYTVDTEMNIKKGLDDKVKRALKKSIENELDKKIKGSGVRKINLDFSSSDEDDIKGGTLTRRLYDIFNPTKSFEEWREREKGRQMTDAEARRRYQEEQAIRLEAEARRLRREAEEELKRKKKSAEQYGRFEGDEDNPMTTEYERAKRYYERLGMTNEDIRTMHHEGYEGLGIKKKRGRPRKIKI